MIYRVAVLSALLVVAMLFSRPALSQISILNGECRDSSHTAEGPIGSDLTKRQSRFYCDSAVLTYFDDQIGHVMIQFAQKASGNTKILGFAGQVQADGIMVRVDHVYLEQGQATAVDDGWCKFFKNDEKRKITGIACGMKRDKVGRRSTAVVEFHAMPNQTSSFKANPDKSKSNLPLSQHLMGTDSLAGGSVNDKWQKVQSGGREIIVMTNGDISGGRFRTYFVANLPESTVVGAPQSVMNDVEGNCSTRHYRVFGSLFFAGKNRSGMPVDNLPPENVERKLVPNSPFEKAFNMLCEIAREQRPPVSAPSLTPEQIASSDEAGFRNLSKNWRNVTSSNGQVYEIAMDTLSHNSSYMGAASLRSSTVYAYGPEERLFNAQNVQKFYFDCRGHFQTFQQGWSPVADISPLSVADKIASIACGHSAQ